MANILVNLLNQDIFSLNLEVVNFNEISDYFLGFILAILTVLFSYFFISLFKYTTHFFEKMSSLIFLKPALGGIIVGISITLGSGGSGGIFTPSLLVGGSLGLFFGHLVNNINISSSDPKIFGIIAMAAFLTSLIKAPFTITLILFELTYNTLLIAPLLI